MPKNSPLFIDIGPGLSMMVGLPKISTWDKKSRPKKPEKGTLGFNSEKKQLEYWDGTGWFAASMSWITSNFTSCFFIFLVI